MKLITHIYITITIRITTLDIMLGSRDPARVNIFRRHFLVFAAQNQNDFRKMQNASATGVASSRVVFSHAPPFAPPPFEIVPTSCGTRSR